MPNGETVNYQLGNLPGIGENTLAKVNHPDGTESTFSSVVNSDGLAELSIKDATADGAYSRNKIAYLATSVGVDSDGESVATVLGMVRRMENGEGEMSYANRELPNGGLMVFEGGNKITRSDYTIRGTISRQSRLAPVTVTNADGSTTESYPWKGNFYGFDTESSDYITIADFIKHGYTLQTGHTIDPQGRRTTQHRDALSQEIVGDLYILPW